MARYVVETKVAKFALDTNPPKAGILERYPAVPRPITVEPSCVARYVVETKPVRFAVDTISAKLAVLTSEPRVTVEM